MFKSLAWSNSLKKLSYTQKTSVQINKLATISSNMTILKCCILYEKFFIYKIWAYPVSPSSMFREHCNGKVSTLECGHFCTSEQPINTIYQPKVSQKKYEIIITNKETSSELWFTIRKKKRNSFNDSWISFA